MQLLLLGLTLVFAFACKGSGDATDDKSDVSADGSGLTASLPGDQSTDLSGSNGAIIPTVASPTNPTAGQMPITPVPGNNGNNGNGQSLPPTTDEFPPSSDNNTTPLPPSENPSDDATADTSPAPAAKPKRTCEYVVKETFTAADDTTIDPSVTNTNHARIMGNALELHPPLDKNKLTAFYNVGKYSYKLAGDFRAEYSVSDFAAPVGVANTAATAELSCWNFNDGITVRWVKEQSGSYLDYIRRKSGVHEDGANVDVSADTKLAFRVDRLGSNIKVYVDKGAGQGYESVFTVADVAKGIFFCDLFMYKDVADPSQDVSLRLDDVKLCAEYKSVARNCSADISEDFSGTAFSRELWTYSDDNSENIHVQKVDGVGKLTATGGEHDRGGQLLMKWPFSGDFAAEMTILDVSAESINHAGLQLQFLDIANNHAVVDVNRTSSADGYSLSSSLGGANASIDLASAPHDPSKIKVVRIGGEVKVYIDTGSGYVLLQQASGVDDPYLMFRIVGGSHSDAFPDMSATFDDFRLSCPAD